MDRLSLLSLLVGGVLPLLVALVTKASWPEPLKALLLAVFSAATGVGSALENPHGVDYRTVLANAALAFVSGAAVAAGTWKPTGVLGKLESIFVHDIAPAVEHALEPSAPVLTVPPTAMTTITPVPGGAATASAPAPGWTFTMPSGPSVTTPMTVPGFSVPGTFVPAGASATYPTPGTAAPPAQPEKPAETAPEQPPEPPAA